MERKAIASTWITPFIGDNPFYYNRTDGTMKWERALCAGEYGDREYASIGSENPSNMVAPTGTSDVLFTGFNLEDIPANSTIHSIRAVFYLQTYSESSYSDGNYQVGFYGGEDRHCCVEYSIKSDLGGLYVYGKSRTVDLTGKVTAADLKNFGIRLSVLVKYGVCSMSYTYGGCSLYIDYTPGEEEKIGALKCGESVAKMSVGDEVIHAVYAGDMRLY